ncbi:PAS domain-containing sensor histidine kinase [Verrucomicrobiota bacterium sgz303538]
MSNSPADHYSLSGENFAQPHQQTVIDQLAQKVRELEAANLALIKVNSELRAEIAATKQDQDNRDLLDSTKLRQQKQRLSDIVASVPGIVWEAWGTPDAANQRTDFVSDFVEEMTGYSREEWVSNPDFWLTLAHPDDKERAAREAAALFAGGNGGTVTLRWIAKNGRVLWVEIHTVVILDGAGVPVGLRGVTMEITARKEAERLRLEMHEALDLRVIERTAALAEANCRLEAEISVRKRTEEELCTRKEAFKAIAENSPDFINRIDCGFRNLYANRTPERFVGKTLDEAGFPAELVTFWKKHIQAVFDTHQPGEMSFEVPVEGDTQLFYNSRLVPEFTATGEVASALIVSRDITELKHAEKELRFQKTLLEAQRETSLDGILVATPEGRMMSFNRRFIEMWHMPPQVIASRSDGASLQIALSQVIDPDAFLAKVTHLYEHRDETSRDEIRLKDGRIFDRYSAPVIGQDGHDYGRIWFFRDITERKLLERKVIETSNREQRRLGQDLHDDLGQWLTATHLEARALSMFLKPITDAGAARADKLVCWMGEALQRTRMLARGMAPAVIETGGLSAALEELASNTGLMFRGRCQYTCDETVNVRNPEAALQLYRIAQEAISNALRHGDASEVSIYLEAMDNGRGRLMIRDNGKGVPYPLPKTLGLGLRIMQYRAELLGANVDIAPSHGGGTEVACTFSREL